ncbi:hypothetical protein RRG08_065059 [Elysia crispata]|uniref:Uncharacterized protein n=1 Tax=Elysia crispata TaxID=231223 RepID=A0AAE1DI01_9GAST|nr:hypothetical protein RRG08_065059 [Elysia crispata]
MKPCHQLVSTALSWKSLPCLFLSCWTFTVNLHATKQGQSAEYRRKTGYENLFYERILQSGEVSKHVKVSLQHLSRTGQVQKGNSSRSPMSGFVMFPIVSSSISEVNASIPGVISSYRSTSTRLRRMNTSATDGNLTRKRINTSAREGNLTRKRMNTSATDGNLTRKRMNTSEREGNLTRKRMNTSAREGNLTRKRMNTSAREGNLTRKRMNTSATDGNLTRKRMNTSAREGNLTWKTMNTSAREGNLTRKRMNTSAREGNLTRKRMNTSAREGNLTRKRMNTSAMEGNLTRKRMTSNTSAREGNLTRKRRYDYEDTYEWPPDESAGYDFDDDHQEEELTFWQDAARNWQVVALRAIFLFCFLAFISMIILFFCYVSCTVCCHSLIGAVTPWRPVFEYLSQCYEDPMYAKARDVADAFGIKLDYATYQKIRETHEFGGRGGWNPHNLE